MARQEIRDLRSCEINTRPHVSKRRRHVKEESPGISQLVMEFAHRASRRIWICVRTSRTKGAVVECGYYVLLYGWVWSTSSTAATAKEVDEFFDQVMDVMWAPQDH